MCLLSLTRMEIIEKLIKESKIEIPELIFYGPVKYALSDVFGYSYTNKKADEVLSRTIELWLKMDNPTGTEHDQIALVAVMEIYLGYFDNRSDSIELVYQLDNIEHNKSKLKRIYIKHKKLSKVGNEE
jgi:hypothetical protein